MPLPTRAVDASYDQLTVTEAQCLNRSSWPLYVQCLWTAIEQPPARVESLRTAKNAGLDIAGYISLNNSGSGANHVMSGKAGVPDDLWDAMEFVAVDVELRGITEQQILRAVEAVESLGQKVVIYTSWNAWNNLVAPGNPTSLKHIPLWNALWDRNPDFDFPTLRYGGWVDSMVFMEQWSGGTDVCGQFVDRNTVVNPTLVYGPINGTPEVPAQVLMKQLLTMTVPIFGNVGSPKTLHQLLHYAYHGGPGVVKKESIVKLREAVVHAQAGMTLHLREHASSGGLIDRVSGESINRMADLLDALEGELRLIVDGEGGT